MKTMFAIISCLAIVYLLAQTNLVKETSKTIYDGVISSQTLNQNVKDLTKQDIEKLLSNYKEASKKYEILAQQLNMKVDELELQVQSLEQQLVSIELPVQEKNQQNTNADNTHLQDVSAAPAISLTADSSEKTLPKTEQQKRLQQQAVLRQIAQKMELSALNGLSAGK